MARIQRNLANKTNSFEEIDKLYAYMIWLAEKEFNIGPITEDYLVLKFWNLFDEENIRRYKEETDKIMSGGGSRMPKTFG